jgi:Arc/MetJ-type ribon-helix-helix transcriptional regulator
MERIAAKKVHFAPFERQRRAVERLVKEGQFRDVTDFMRRAVDSYLDRLGKPTLQDQARQMAEDFARHHGCPGAADPSQLQDPSRDSSEEW